MGQCNNEIKKYGIQLILVKTTAWSVYWIYDINVKSTHRLQIFKLT